MVGNSCLAAAGQFALGGRLEHELLRLALGESLSLARGSLSGGFRSVYAVALACGGGGAGRCTPYDLLQKTL